MSGRQRGRGVGTPGPSPKAFVTGRTESPDRGGANKARSFACQQLDARLEFVYHYIDGEEKNDLLEDIVLEYDEIASVLRRLGVSEKEYKKPTTEVEATKELEDVPYIVDMLWELDGNGNDTLCWDEVRLAYRKTAGDRTGYEPRKFITLVDFLLMDEDHNFYLTESKIIDLMTLRYGFLESDPEVQAMLTPIPGRAGGTMRPSHEVIKERTAARARHISFTEFTRRFGAAIRVMRSKHRQGAFMYKPGFTDRVLGVK